MIWPQTLHAGGGRGDSGVPGAHDGPLGSGVFSKLHLHNHTHMQRCQNSFLRSNASTEELKEFSLLSLYEFLPRTPECCPQGLVPGRPAIRTPEPGESRGDGALLYACSTCPPPSPERERENFLNKQPTP